jgi:hypothetical protein
MNSNVIVADQELVAYCGLYCGACGSYLKNKCLGCHENEKASWCKVRQCCQEAKLSSCADCKTFSDPRDCKKYNNFISKAIGIVLRSDRRACIMQIKEKGLQKHAEDMALNRRQTIRS